MKKETELGNQFRDVWLHLNLILFAIATEERPILYSTGASARAMMVEIADGRDLSMLESKLLTLKLLIVSNFVKNRSLVSYSFLMTQMGISYVELIRLLITLAIIDHDNDDPTSDSLVTNDGDDVPPSGFFTSGVTGRSELVTEEDREKYHYQMVRRYCTYFGVRLRPVAKLIGHVKKFNERGGLLQAA